MLKTPKSTKKGVNRSLFPSVQTTKLSNRSHSLANNINNQTLIHKEVPVKIIKQLTVAFSLLSFISAKATTKVSSGGL